MHAGSSCCGSGFGTAAQHTVACVQVLGTLITEWEAGAAVCRQLFGSKAAALRAAAQLAAMAAAANFDGWLVNIENDLPLDCVPHVLDFLRWSLIKSVKWTLRCMAAQKRFHSEGSQTGLG